jgi:hypothetical protein
MKNIKLFDLIITRDGLVIIATPTKKITNINQFINQEIIFKNKKYKIIETERCRCGSFGTISEHLRDILFKVKEI